MAEDTNHAIYEILVIIYAQAEYGDYHDGHR